MFALSPKPSGATIEEWKKEIHAALIASVCMIVPITLFFAGTWIFSEGKTPSPPMQAQNAEEAACARAGLRAPAWTRDGTGAPRFTCVTPDGRVVPVTAPSCNASSLVGCAK